MPHAHAIVKEEYARPVSRWLFLCAALVMCMVALGGYTRLSGSGLSITEWKPVYGVIPPLNEAQWRQEFDAYRATPQYAAVNRGMTIKEFKRIYWPEYFHRLLGRTLGIVFLLPFLWFCVRRAFNLRFGIRLGLIFALGAAQGLVGWLMVLSGIEDGPYVSHLRLAAHLSLAFALLALILWSALDAAPPKSLRGPRWLWLVFILLYIQIFFGAMLAGLHGGLVYNTFPTMNGEWIPTGILSHKPAWAGFFTDITDIQFTHRWLAALVATLYLLWWWSARQYGKSGLKLSLALVVLLQFSLGVATLLAAVPLPLALAHQLCALLLYTLTVIMLNRLKYRKTT